MNVTIEWLGRVAYAEALERQEQMHAARCRGEIGDSMLLLEHEPVYTIGRTRDHSSLRDVTSLPHPIVEVNRGGQATYHGPGQLIGYPILDLRRHGGDVRVYLRTLEDVLIGALAAFSITATRREGLTGVWVEDRKIASIGVGVRFWVSMHGFALNVCGDLSPFESITPCGIAGVQMTNIAIEANREFTVRDATNVVSRSFLSIFG
jgi:lipoyl(octanoyl) transferase